MKENNLDTIYAIPQDLLPHLYRIVMYEKYGLGNKDDYIQSVKEVDKRKKQIGVITNVKT